MGSTDVFASSSVACAVGFRLLSSDGSGTYRVDGTGLVYAASGRTFVANLTDADWLAYTVITVEAEYDVTLQVHQHSLVYTAVTPP